jgi:hypothetical protein
MRRVHFLKIFLPGAYLRESFAKRAKKTKKTVLETKFSKDLVYNLQGYRVSPIQL